VTPTSIGLLFINPIPLTPLQHDASMTKQTPILADELQFEDLVSCPAIRLDNNRKSHVHVSTTSLKSDGALERKCVLSLRMLCVHTIVPNSLC
jgi:hypothetical protein